jgi:hypothetical protein
VIDIKLQFAALERCGRSEYFFVAKHCAVIDRRWDVKETIAVASSDGARHYPDSNCVQGSHVHTCSHRHVVSCSHFSTNPCELVQHTILPLIVIMNTIEQNFVFTFEIFVRNVSDTRKKLIAAAEKGELMVPEHLRDLSEDPKEKPVAFVAELRAIICGTMATVPRESFDAEAYNNLLNEFNTGGVMIDDGYQNDFAETDEMTKCL